MNPIQCVGIQNEYSTHYTHNVVLEMKTDKSRHKRYSHVKKPLRQLTPQLARKIIKFIS